MSQDLIIQKWFDSDLEEPTGGLVNYTLTCDAGAYTYTGQAATFVFARKLALDAGSYTYTGQPATLAYGRTLSLATGSYTYTGQAVTFALERKLALAVGSYSYAGVAAVLTLAKKLALDAGAYNYAGNDATLTYSPGAGATNYTLTCDAGAYAYTGNAATFVLARKLALDVGAYNYTGNDATLTYASGTAVVEPISYGWIEQPTRKKKKKHDKPLEEPAEVKELIVEHEVPKRIQVAAQERYTGIVSELREINARAEAMLVTERKRIEAERYEHEQKLLAARNKADRHAIQESLRILADVEVRTELEFIASIKAARDRMADAEARLQVEVEIAAQLKNAAEEQVSELIHSLELAVTLEQLRRADQALNELIDQDDEEVLALL